jgi:pyruvate kinase
MFPSDGIRSQLEWNATLSTANAPVPTEQTKFLRKVRRWSSKDDPRLIISNRHLSSPPSVCSFVSRNGRAYGSLLLGPKVNTVEKLAELRRAGVNVGA